jgi:hypothetical protein
MSQVAGIADVYWLGQQIDVKPVVTLQLGGVVNKPVVVGRKIKRAQVMVEAVISAKFSLDKGLRITDLINADQEGELQVHFDSGQKFIWADAFVSDATTLTTGDGSEGDVKFGAGIHTEIT